MKPHVWIVEIYKGKAWRPWLAMAQPTEGKARNQLLRAKLVYTDEIENKFRVAKYVREGK